MNSDLIQQQIAVSLLQGIGPIRARRMLAKLPNIDTLFTASLKELEHLTGISQKILRKMNRQNALVLAKKEVEFVLKHNIQPYFLTDTTYPRRLKQCEDAPLMLYGKGNLELNPTKTVAIVGTRNATAYGIKVCEELIQSFVGQNILVVSGMAYGIDICVHQLCVSHNVPTIGVLGHGLDRMYPQSHNATAQRMLNQGGLLTEFVSGTQPDRENFPMRNRIVAGMCDATIVVESKNKGGSLITAELANDYSRDVFAVPGNIGQTYSEGCNQLISQSKAHLYHGPNSFLKWMNWQQTDTPKISQRQLFMNLNEEEQEMLGYLEKEGEQHMDMLAQKTKKPISQTSVLLFHLEMSGWVKALPGKKYALVH